MRPDPTRTVSDDPDPNEEAAPLRRRRRAGGDRRTTIRFSWWGNEERAGTTRAAVKAFEADVITMGGSYPREYGVPTGVNTFGLIADPALFAGAGVPMPDDDMWTWDDFVEVATAISTKTSGKVRGIGKVTDRKIVLGPEGSTSSTEILRRVGQSVLFARTSPQDGGRQFVEEMKKAIARR
ncbi:MAG: pectin-derived oligosaccharide transport system substrate-binding protein [Actinomycetota bacterium]|nr:pectin-derived oligosaccharide transport system substrate-binding protein [Actinomycetota bacterium]